MKSKGLRNLILAVAVIALILALYSCSHRPKEEEMHSASDLPLIVEENLADDSSEVDDEKYGTGSEVDSDKDKEEKDPDNKDDKDPSGSGSNTGTNQGSSSGGNNASGSGSTGGNTTPNNPGGNTGGSTGGNSGGNTTPSTPTQPEEPKYPYTMIKWGLKQEDAYQCDICKKPFRDIPSLNAHYCVPMTPCSHDWEDITEKVHHDEVGHYENRCTQEAWDEPVKKWMSICKVCGAAFGTSNEVTIHLVGEHNNNGSYMVDQVVVDYIHHDAVYQDVYVVDQKAYDEYVVTGQKCKLCGETK